VIQRLAGSGRDRALRGPEPSSSTTAVAAALRCTCRLQAGRSMQRRGNSLSAASALPRAPAASKAPPLPTCPLPPTCPCCPRLLRSSRSATSCSSTASSSAAGAGCCCTPSPSPSQPLSSATCGRAVNGAGLRPAGPCRAL
jgi:hypothetical protein